ncbi:hypothetical protein AGMMS49975_11590 [Clostridia bacterium]|nr:hypothetical protein AGMMS49975_11590 [Clostridia bacterium]
MAFINERLTDEQKKEFEDWGIKKPVVDFGIIFDEYEHPMDSPVHWTVDKDRNTYLIGIPPAMYELSFPDERIFVFIWDGKSYVVQFKGIAEDRNTISWNIPSKYLIKDRFPYSMEVGFLETLRAAFFAFKVFGSCDRLNESVFVKCNF